MHADPIPQVAALALLPDGRGAPGGEGGGRGEGGAGCSQSQQQPELALVVVVGLQGGGTGCWAQRPFRDQGAQLRQRMRQARRVALLLCALHLHPSGTPPIRARPDRKAPLGRAH